jgi:predicted lipoprotein with Yx(FWY)xxD motif
MPPRPATTRTAAGLAAVVALALALGVAACGGQSGTTNAAGASASYVAPAPPPGSIKLRSASVGGQTIVVNAVGRTLYVFLPDEHRRVSCGFDCQSDWPPEIAPSRGPALAERAVRQSLIGSVRNPIGGRVVTYAGWPLYTFVTDDGAGQERGQGLDLNGGYWYVISVTGEVIR